MKTVFWCIFLKEEKTSNIYIREKEVRTNHGIQTGDLFFSGDLRVHFFYLVDFHSFWGKKIAQIPFNL